MSNGANNSQRAKKEPGELMYWLYSTGNIPNNIIFTMVGTYVTFFYTDILGISAIAAGTIFMVARLVDAITDPLMGMIVDRTNTRFGKFRPYIIAGSPLLAIAFMLLFTAPDLSPNGKIAYAFTTYIIYSLMWTVVQIPQLAMPAMLTNDLAKRTRIQAIFQAFGTVGAMIVTSWTLPILDRLGGQDNPVAWFRFTAIFGTISAIMFIISAMSIRSVDVYNPNAIVEKDNRSIREKINFKDTMKAVLSNKALLCVLIAFGTDQFASQITSTLRIYFFKYNMAERTDLIVYIGYVTTIAGFAAVLFIQPMVKKLGKKYSIIVVESLAILVTLPLLFTGLSGNYGVGFVMFTFLSIAFTYNTTNLLSRAAVLDSANYAQVETGVNATATVNSTFTFVNKCCQSFSMFFGGAILSMTGYDGSLTQQADSTLMAILLLMTIVPIIGYICSIVAMKFYPLSPQQEVELEEKMNNLEKLEN